MNKKAIAKMVMKMYMTNLMLELVLAQVKYMLEHHPDAFRESYVAAANKVMPEGLSTDTLEKLMEYLKK